MPATAHIPARPVPGTATSPAASPLLPQHPLAVLSLRPLPEAESMPMPGARLLLIGLRLSLELEVDREPGLLPAPDGDGLAEHRPERLRPLRLVARRGEEGVVDVVVEDDPDVHIAEVSALKRRADEISHLTGRPEQDASPAVQAVHVGVANPGRSLPGWLRPLFEHAAAAVQVDGIARREAGDGLARPRCGVGIAGTPAFVA